MFCLVLATTKKKLSVPHLCSLSDFILNGGEFCKQNKYNKKKNVMLIKTGICRRCENKQNLKLCLYVRM